jgi:hypothetical protein
MNNYLSVKEARGLNDSSPAAQLFGLGDKLRYILNQMGIVGEIFYLDPANGDDAASGLDIEEAVKTLPVGYDKLRANKNDVLIYLGNNGSVSLSSKLTWAKNYAHLIGFAAPVGIGGRARIFQAAAATGVSPLIDFTGSGNIIKNVYIFHGVNDATSKICSQVTGHRNYFENVHFAGIGNATMDVAGAASLKIDGGAENLFKNCFIGLDTIAVGANGVELLFDSAATRNRFEECILYRYISAAGHTIAKVEDVTGIDRFQYFKKCLFMTDSENQATTMTSVFSIPSGIVQGKIILDDCSMITDGASGSGDWDSNNRGVVWNNTPAPAASAAGGVMTKQ